MKNNRQAVILEIIKQESIETQEELVQALRRNGIDATQATVSRDIKQMHLLKVRSDRGVYKYATPDQADHWLSDRFARIFVDSVESIDYAMNMIVIKTLSGSANAACEAIDSMHMPEILGTMAGDNTIFIVVHDPAQAAQVTEKFRSIVG